MPLICLDVCRQNASRPGIYCKPSTVFKAKRNKHSVSQPKPQQHKRCFCQQELLAKRKLAALQFSVQQQACHTVWRSGKPRSSSNPRFTSRPGLFFIAFTISLSNSYNSPLLFLLPTAARQGYCSCRHRSVHGKQ